MKLLEHGNLIDNDWRFVEDDMSIPASGKIIVSFDRLNGDDAEHLFHKDCCLGVLLDPSDELEKLASWATRLNLIVVDIRHFSDGRAFSAARIIRQNIGYEGKLRARGDLLPDLHQFMVQVGFDSFELPDGRLEPWVDGSLHVPLSYQSDYKVAGPSSLSVLAERYAAIERPLGG